MGLLFLVAIILLIYGVVKAFNLGLELDELEKKAQKTWMIKVNEARKNNRHSGLEMLFDSHSEFIASQEIEQKALQIMTKYEYGEYILYQHEKKRLKASKENWYSISSLAFVFIIIVIQL